MAEDRASKLITLGVLEYFLAKLDLRFQHQETGKGLSENDFTNELKSKLEHIDPELFATADEVDEVLDQFFPGDVDPDEPINGNAEQGNEQGGEPGNEDPNGDVGQGGDGDTDLDDETQEAGAAEDEVEGGGADLDDLDEILDTDSGAGTDNSGN